MQSAWWRVKNNYVLIFTGFLIDTKMIPRDLNPLDAMGISLNKHNNIDV